MIVFQAMGLRDMDKISVLSHRFFDCITPYGHVKARWDMACFTSGKAQGALDIDYVDEESPLPTMLLIQLLY